MKTFGQITLAALQCAWRAKKARHQAAAGGFHAEATATGTKFQGIAAGESRYTTDNITALGQGQRETARHGKGAARSGGGGHSDRWYIDADGRRVYVLK